jgi:RNA polymerase sigma-70 factor (ECF subfamily)
MSEEPLIKQLLQRQSLFMGYLVAITHDVTAAEEIFQNVAVVVLERGTTEPIRDFHAWAKEIVRRQALHYLRSQSSARVRPLAPELLEGLSLALAGDLHETDPAAAEREALTECLKNLDARSRRMMTLRYEKRESFEAIAEVLEASAQGVQRALSRIRQALHDCVKSRLVAAQGR